MQRHGYWTRYTSFAFDIYCNPRCIRREDCSKKFNCKQKECSGQRGLTSAIGENEENASSSCDCTYYSGRSQCDTDILSLMNSNYLDFTVAAIISIGVIVFVLAPILRKMSAIAEEDIRRHVLTAEDLLETGASPVVYLRSFDADGAKSSEWWLAEKLGFLAPTIEADMVSVLREEG